MATSTTETGGPLDTAAKASIGMTLLAVDFCAQPETWPVFLQYLKASGVDADPDTLAGLMDITKESVAATQMLAESATNAVFTITTGQVIEAKELQ